MNNFIFKVLRAGINTTYQDKGRYGLQHIGVTPGGCMDQMSFLIANALVGNSNNIGVIEFAYQGPLLQLIKGKIKIAITGNVYFKIINLNNDIIVGECNRTYNLNEGDKIDILATNKSAYGYLSIEGGFNMNWLNFREIDTDLEKYVTNQAIEGLFFLIAQEEKNIRRNPKARVSEILEKVFK